MRIVDRRYLAALLALWLVLAVGLVAQAVPPSDATISADCASTCTVGVETLVRGDGLNIKPNTVLTSFWLRLQTNPDGYQRVFARPDGTWVVRVIWYRPGDQEICITYFKQSGQIDVLACTTVTVLP